MSEDGCLLAFACARFRRPQLELWDHSGPVWTCKKTLRGETKSGTVLAVALASNNCFLAALCERGLCIVFNCETEPCLLELRGLAKGLSGYRYPLLRFSPDASLLALGSKKAVKLVCTNTWKSLEKIRSGVATSIAFAPTP